MTFAKISAGTGYLYLIRHTALGDADPTGERDAAAYYAAAGNPPGRWTGRGAPLLGLAGRTVNEGQMRALFGLGAHPDMDAIVDAYIDERWRPRMTGERWDRLVGDAIRSATLGRQFPRYRQLDPFGDRVAARLDVIRGDAGREPTEAEAARARAREARRQRDAVAGYDLVFSPVKSAALLWAVDPRPRVQEGIAAAHAAAKDAAHAVLEEHAAFTRTGTDGMAQIATRVAGGGGGVDGAGVGLVTGQARSRAPTQFVELRAQPPGLGSRSVGEPGRHRLGGRARHSVHVDGPSQARTAPAIGYRTFTGLAIAPSPGPGIARAQA